MSRSVGLTVVNQCAHVFDETPETALCEVVDDEAGEHAEQEAEQYSQRHGVYALVGQCLAFFPNSPGRMRLISFAHGVGIPLNFHWLMACGVMSPSALAIAVGPLNAAITRAASWSICLIWLIKN